MKSFLVSLFLTFGLAAFGQERGLGRPGNRGLPGSRPGTSSSEPVTGDPIGAEILPNGWQLKLTFKDMATNGVYDFGLEPTILNNGASNVLQSSTSPKVKVNFTDMAYVEDFTQTTVASSVVGTHAVRIPYQGAAADGSGGTSANGSVLHTNRFQETTNSGSISVIVALQDYVWARSSNVTVNIGAGFYTAAGASNNAGTAITVTNNSTVPYMHTIAAWSDVPFQVKQGSTYKVRAVGFHWSARDFRPVKAVKVWSVCGARTNEPVILTNFVVDATFGDQTPVVEAVATMDNTPFQQLDLVTNHCQIIPWVGDTNAFVDTTGQAAEFSSTNGWGKMGTFVTIADPDSTLNQTVAYVDPVTAVGAAGVAFTNSYSSPNVAGAIPFATIGQALTAIAGTNQAIFGAQSNVVPATIFLAQGNHMAVGTNNVALAMPQQAWVTVDAEPGVSRDLVVITNKGTGQFNSGSRDWRLHVKDVTLSFTASLWNDGLRSFWLDSSVVASNGNSSAFIVSSASNNYATFNTFGRYRAGFTFTVNNGVKMNIWRLVRGNLFTNAVEGLPQVFIGNLQLPATNVQNTVQNDNSSTNIALATMNPFINAFNRYYRNDVSVLSLGWGLRYSNCVDVAVIQNLIEGVNGNYPALDSMNSQVPGEWVTNNLVWNNTVLCTYHPPFNHATNQTEYLTAYSDKNNILAAYDVGYDTLATGNGSQQNGVRTNRWARLYSVGSSGNASANLGRQSAECESIGAQGNYGFRGINSVFFGDDGGAVTNSTAFGFVDNESNLTGSTTVTPGHGDYAISTNSALLDLPPLEQLIPYDIAGNTRTTNAPPGAYLSE